MKVAAVHLERLIPIALLALAAVLMSGRLDRWARTRGWSHLVRSRLHFLVLGLLLSRMGTDALESTVLQSLDAFVTLSLGLLGLLLGLTISSPLKPRGDRLLAAASIESSGTLLLTAVPFYLALEPTTRLTWQQRAIAAALIGCAAAISGRRLFGAGRRSDEARFQSLNRVADLGTVFGVLAAGALLALLSPVGGVSPGEKLVLLAATGVIGGLGAWLLTWDMRPGGLRISLLLGVLLVTAGTATHLSLPPVAATLLMGLTIARLPGGLAHDLRANLAFLEAPCRALLLIIAGLALPALNGTIVATVALFLALRSAGKILGGHVASVAAHGSLPRQMGLGLLPSSAIAVGLALDFRATAPSEISDIVVAITVLGSLLSETVGLWTTWVLSRAIQVSETAREAVLQATRIDPVAGQEAP